MSDGTTPTDAKYKDFTWKVERYDNINKKFTVVKTYEGESIDFWVPYGTAPGYYKVTAVPKADPDIWGETWCYKDFFWMFPNYCICEKGNVKYGRIKGDTPAAGSIKTIYNEVNDTYTSVLPECPYNSSDYTFIGWKKDGRIYKPGSKYTGNRGFYKYAYFEAQWKPNFKSPDLVVNKVGKKKIKLSWNRMIGGKGYKIYRSTKKNGKYKLVKTIKNKLTTSWTDKKVDSGKEYYYKVAAYKKGSQKKSAWVLTSTNAAKVKSIKLNKTSIRGVVGKSAKVKATVKTAKGKKLSKKVRWYTSDKKIAKINQKTGKVTFVKTGTCQIWAKAYNGKNSKKIKVIVR